MYSIVIPVHNEESSIVQVINNLSKCLSEAGIDFEIVVVDDGSTDSTYSKLVAIKNPHLRILSRLPPNGFGYAIREGFSYVRGDVIAVVMGDGSDDVRDIRDAYRCLDKEVDCVFGNRFLKRRSVKDYAILKLVLNRLGNHFISLAFGINHTDITNAFKVYRNNAIKSIPPLKASSFDICLELPIKVVSLGYRFKTIPISWSGRRTGKSKLKLLRTLPMYIKTLYHLWIDYRCHKKQQVP